MISSALPFFAGAITTRLLSRTDKQEPRISYNIRHRPSNLEGQRNSRITIRLNAVLVTSLIASLVLTCSASHTGHANQLNRVDDVLSKALQAAQSSDDQLLRALALVTVGTSYAKVGQKDKAAELLSAALPLIKSYEPAPSVEIAVKELALGEIALRFSEIGQQNKAIEAISLAAQSPIMTARDSSKAQYVAQLAVWYMKAGQEGKGLELLEQAFQLSKSVEDYIGRSSSLEHISASAIEAGERELALEIAQAIQKGPFRAAALSKVAISYAERDEYDKALEIAKTIEEIAFIPETLIAIADRYVEAGQKEQAMKLLDHASRAANSKEFTSARGRSDLRGLAVTYAKIGQIDKALKLALRDWPKYNPDMEALAEIAIQYFKAGQHSKGEKVVSRMIQVSQSFESAHYKASDLADVAGIRIEVGQRDKGLDLLSKALQVARTEKDDFQGNYVLSEIANEVCRCQRVR